MAIHPTAIVHPRAEIGSDCEIGPFCIVGEHVVMGAGNRLHSHVVIDGHTRIGSHNQIYPFATVGLKTQDLKWKGGTTWTELGDHNTIRENVTIHSATGDGEYTRIGSYNNFLANSHIGHNVVMGNRIIVSMAALAGHVTVEDFALVGGLAAVHQFCRIGTMSIIGGVSKVTQDVPPYMLVDGNPAETRAINKVGLDRNGVSDEAQRALRQAHRLIFRERLTITQALERVENEVPQVAEVKHLVTFIRGSERGVTR
jgi:UDP-N-acetylglucosamine acyltransferase